MTKYVFLIDKHCVCVCVWGGGGEANSTQCFAARLFVLFVWGNVFSLFCLFFSSDRGPHVIGPCDLMDHFWITPFTWEHIIINTWTIDLRLKRILAYFSKVWKYRVSYLSYILVMTSYANFSKRRTCYLCPIYGNSV